MIIKEYENTTAPLSLGTATVGVITCTVGEVFLIVDTTTVGVTGTVVEKSAVVSCTLVGVIIIGPSGAGAERKSVVGIASLGRNMLNIDGEISGSLNNSVIM